MLIIEDRKMPGKRGRPRNNTKKHSVVVEPPVMDYWRILSVQLGYTRHGRPSVGALLTGIYGLDEGDRVLLENLLAKLFDNKQNAD